MANDTADYAHGRSAATDEMVVAWLARVEKKLDRLTWQVAAIAAVIPLLTTVIIFLLRAQLFG